MAGWHRPTLNNLKVRDLFLLFNILIIFAVLLLLFPYIYYYVVVVAVRSRSGAMRLAKTEQNKKRKEVVSI